VEDAFKINDWNLGAAFLTDVLRGVGRHVHLVAAGTEGHAAEQVDSSLGDRLSGAMLLGHDRRTAVPEFLRYHRLDFVDHPLLFGFVNDSLAIDLFGVVHSTHPFGYRVDQNPLDGQSRERLSRSSPVPGCV